MLDVFCFVLTCIGFASLVSCLALLYMIWNPACHMVEPVDEMDEDWYK